MIRSLAPAKPPLYLVPGEVDNRRSAVEVVCRKSRVAKRGEERAHLRLRQLHTGLDRRFAGDRRRETLVLRGSAGDTVSRESIERLPQTTLGVKARVRHRHGIHDQRVSSKSFDLESQPLEVFAIGIERVALSGAEVKCQRKQEPLRGRGAALQRMHELFVEHALVRGMLIDEHQPILVLERDVGASELDQRWYRSGRSCNIREFLLGEWRRRTRKFGYRLLE